MKIARPVGVAATAVLLSVLTACGGSSGASSPEDAAQQALEAVVDRDYEAACDLQLNSDDKPMTDEQKEECVKEGKEAMKKADEQLDALPEEAKKAGEEQQKKLEELLDTKPKVGKEKDGEVLVTYDLDGVDFPLTTKKVDGSWYVAG